MRELKYKAFDKTVKKVVDVWDIMWINGEPDAIVCYNPYNHDDNEWELDKGTYELLQYTGLKDCNGVDIYEGDIISEDPSIWNGHFYYFIVNMRDGCWEAKSTIPCDKNGRGCLLFNIKNPKVEGNKFENPELLKE